MASPSSATRRRAAPSSVAVRIASASRSIESLRRGIGAEVTPNWCARFAQTNWSLWCGRAPRARLRGAQPHSSQRPHGATAAAQRGNSHENGTGETTSMSSPRTVGSIAAGGRRRTPRRPARRRASTTTRVVDRGSSSMLLPNPMNTGGSPAARKSTNVSLDETGCAVIDDLIHGSPFNLTTSRSPS